MSAPEMSDYGRALRDLVHAVNRVQQYSFCRVCRVAVPRNELVNGACADHRDEPTMTAGCAECGAVSVPGTQYIRHARGCCYVE
jgi:hypothetical protein